MLIFDILDIWFFWPYNFIALSIPFLKPVSWEPPSGVSIVLQKEFNEYFSLSLKLINISHFSFTLMFLLIENFLSNNLDIFLFLKFIKSSIPF